MNIVLLIIFIVIFSGNKKDRKKSDLFQLIFRLYLLITVASWFISSPVLWFAAIALIIFMAVKKAKDKEEEQQNRHKADYERMKQKWEQRRQQNAGQSESSYTASKILPKPLVRRNRIISTFNDKYDLSLTEEEIRRIAEASYVSESWKREVEAMTVRYETEGQWFAGPTDWLRVYIYAFEIQNISSDFGLQEQICFETLDEVMAYACAVPDATVEERIQRINDRYFTRFNEMSFMIAYRFLQRKGRNYDLSRPDLVKNVDQELEETMKKYRTGTKG